MSDILCVTNRALCKNDFLTRIENIAKASPAGIILREKDLPEAEYEILAKKVMEICEKHSVACILHSFTDTAIKLKADKIHLPLHLLSKLTEQEKRQFSVIGGSCHSVEDAVLAQKLGCTYISAGHIFATDCKKGLPPRGIDFLKQVCDSVSIPVYAIGGITCGSISLIRRSGAAGGCVMSGLMSCENPAEYLDKFRKEYGNEHKS